MDGGSVLGTQQEAVQHGPSYNTSTVIPRYVFYLLLESINTMRVSISIIAILTLMQSPWENEEYRYRSGH